MEIEAFNEYVANRYQKQMDFYKGASAKNQRTYRSFQWLLIILSSLAPVFAALNGLKFDYAGDMKGIDLKWVLIITSSTVAILTTVLKTFNYQELWVTYRATYEKLKPEIYYYKCGAGPYAEDGQDKERLFITRIEAIMGSEHELWPPAKKMKDQNESGEKQKDDKTTL